MAETSIGSSPRLWGTRVAAGQTGTWKRFIPTPVGNTLGEYQTRTLVAVHPHACGEHHRQIKALIRRGGSSPRLWGTRILTRGARVLYRFIPTPVGNTGQRWAPEEAVAGSSPRLWGTRRLLKGSSRFSGNAGLSI
tara:strand:- start:307 stop:714 length:408 start_codon:yes stop_codon:yes gene_type:complete